MSVETFTFTCPFSHTHTRTHPHHHHIIKRIWFEWTRLSAIFPFSMRSHRSVSLRYGFNANHCFHQRRVDETFAIQISSTANVATQLDAAAAKRGEKGQYCAREMSTCNGLRYNCAHWPEHSPLIQSSKAYFYRIDNRATTTTASNFFLCTDSLRCGQPTSGVQQARKKGREKQVLPLV